MCGKIFPIVQFCRVRSMLRTMYPKRKRTVRSVLRAYELRRPAAAGNPGFTAWLSKGTHETADVKYTKPRERAKTGSHFVAGPPSIFARSGHRLFSEI